MQTLPKLVTLVHITYEQNSVKKQMSSFRTVALATEKLLMNNPECTITSTRTFEIVVIRELPP